ncbi:MAG: NAD(P)-dependent oxidoreductase, partial [Bacteroidota bacterium]|nr:NAD(P)-dependent oxidoreductase [Bacteroidota bacterium]
MSSKRILVTGATGFLGSRLVERLAEDKTVTVTATGRSLKPHNRIDAPNVRYVLGDLTEDAFVEGLVQGQDAIVHAAALSSPWGSKRAFWAANVRPTELLVRAAETHGVERLVLISTPSMYFQMTSQWGLKEEDPLPKPINQYAASKREAERVVEASDIPHVILRPRALLGRGDTVILPRIIR